MEARKKKLKNEKLAQAHLVGSWLMHELTRAVLHSLRAIPSETDWMLLIKEGNMVPLVFAFFSKED